MIPKFQDYYVESLVKDANKDYNFDGSELWYTEHTARTDKGSFLIGIIEESDTSTFRNFLDINILPEFFDIVKKNIDKDLVFLNRGTIADNYIYESLGKKFPTIKINSKKASENIISDVRKLELENKVVLAAIKSGDIYSFKSIIEYI